MISIIDYGMGNLRSVEKALLYLGFKAKITSASKDILNADAIILPGVGAFSEAMKNLERLKIKESILKSLKNGKPFLGICLGMQLLFTESEEFGKTLGLNIILGKVKKFPKKLKTPHLGWNQIEFESNSKLLKGISNYSFVYFVHSYYVEPEDKKVILAKTNYGIKFTSMIAKENIFGCQFHPEKSQDVGLKILKNFGSMRC